MCYRYTAEFVALQQYISVYYIYYYFNNCFAGKPALAGYFLYLSEEKFSR